jgi:curli biogenesis system outer membrane secretion channel CsgG
MQRKSTIWIVAALTILVLASCSTTVSVKSHVPSEVNMSSLRTLAVASVAVSDKLNVSTPSVKTITVGSGVDSTVRIFSRWNSTIEKTLAKYAQDKMYQSLKQTDYFTLVNPSNTDALFKEGKMLGQTRQRFMDAGIDAIISTKLSILSFDEYITSQNRTEYDPVTKTNKDVGIDYYFETSMVINFEYNVVGVAQNKIVTSGSANRDIEDRTLAATYRYGTNGISDGKFTYAISFAPRLDEYYRNAVASLVSNIAIELAPRWVYSTETLMDNKNKIESIKEAYKLASDGNYYEAYSLFNAEWNSSFDLASGYNAAILLYARGMLSEAIDYMSNVCDVTYSTQAEAKLYSMKEAQRLWNIADQQVNGTVPDATVEEFEIRNFFGR